MRCPNDDETYGGKIGSVCLCVSNRDRAERITDIPHCSQGEAIMTFISRELRVKLASMISSSKMPIGASCCRRSSSSVLPVCVTVNSSPKYPPRNDSVTMCKATIAGRNASTYCRIGYIDFFFSNNLVIPRP